MAKRIDPSAIDPNGGRPAAKLLRKYVKQAGAASVQLLDQLARTGSAEIKAAALPELSRLSPKTAEPLVFAAAAALKKRTPKRDIDAAAAACFALGTTKGVGRGLDLVVEHDARASVEPTALILDALAVRWPKLDAHFAREVLAVFGLPHGLRAPALPIASVHAVVRAIAGHAPNSELNRDCAEAVLERGDPESRALVLELGRGDPIWALFGVRATLAGDPREAFDALIATFHANHGRRASVMRSLAADSDPRWAHEALAYAAEEPQAVADALVRLGAADELCDMAIRPTLDKITLCALHGLGRVRDKRAGGLIVEWLRKPEGDAYATILLTAIGGCGGADVIPELETMMTSAGTRAAFYRQAIHEIKAREA